MYNVALSPTLFVGRLKCKKKLLKKKKRKEKWIDDVKKFSFIVPPLYLGLLNTNSAWEVWASNKFNFLQSTNGIRTKHSLVYLYVCFFVYLVLNTRLSIFMSVSLYISHKTQLFFGLSLYLLLCISRSEHTFVLFLCLFLCKYNTKDPSVGLYVCLFVYPVFNTMSFWTSVFRSLCIFLYLDIFPALFFCFSFSLPIWMSLWSFIPLSTSTFLSLFSSSSF